ncbi:predicted protein [Sclerotinia sclerotiorum 1980 UF-70]|uniref:Uncharacterized protein n=1 Tax=Sclerotinia sclerotiorum (strain ATCC 18683 / 1980 / Ss-1) TaxID=665079 RepID=A7E643_SCLS1|nr:predicted protein [Sclerotinia sclerotiorum 1980 UF-70]EDN91365.1 predicted protein [Sclerotinia sclerotiorum 1980 UF-70]
MARLTPSLILFMIASLAIASPLNPMMELIPRTDASQDDSPSTTIVAKNIDGCNVQGMAEAGLTSKIFGTYTLDDLVTCQTVCGRVTPSYNQWMDNLVLSDTSSGIFFSDKYPSDGTNFCYQYA